MDQSAGKVVHPGGEALEEVFGDFALKEDFSHEDKQRQGDHGGAAGAVPDDVGEDGHRVVGGKEGKAEYEKVKSSFIGSAANLISKISNYGPLAALALTGVSYFKQVQGEDNVKYWFLTDANNVALFNAGKTFHQYKKGDVINEASQMKYPLKGKVYLALLNDNTIDPIVVTVKVAAIQVKQEWNTRVKQVMRVINRQEPYLKSN